MLPSQHSTSFRTHSAELTRDALRLDDSYTAGLAVTHLPSAVVAGQLLPVCAADIPFALSLQIQPIPRPSAQRFLLAQTARHGSAQLVSTSRLGNPERDAALEHAQTLRTALERGHEDLFRVSIYGSIRAGSLLALRRLESQLAELLGSAGLGVRRTVLQQLQAFRSVLPQLTNELDDAHYLTTSALAACCRGALARCGCRAPCSGVSRRTPAHRSASTCLPIRR